MCQRRRQPFSLSSIYMLVCGMPVHIRQHGVVAICLWPVFSRGHIEGQEMAVRLQPVYLQPHHEASVLCSLLSSLRHLLRQEGVACGLKPVHCVQEAKGQPEECRSAAWRFR